MAKRTSTIYITQSKRGTTIRATGRGALELFNVLTRAADLKRVKDAVEIKPKADEEWPHGATVKLHWVEGSGRVVSTPGSCGWARRGPAGELLSAVSLTPLDPSCWDVIEERNA